MNTLIQLENKESVSYSAPDDGVRSLKIFTTHKSVFDKESKTFNHFLVVIGYSGGGCQEECFYKISSSNFEKSTVLISTSVGDSFYQFSYKNKELFELESEMSQFDKQIQREFIETTNKYLSYDDILNYFFFDIRKITLESGFMVDVKFPIKILNFLKNVYWPFSASW